MQSFSDHPDYQIFISDGLGFAEFRDHDTGLGMLDDPRQTPRAFGARVNSIRGQRRAERASVLLPASIVTMSAYRFPELLNISKTGAKLRGEPLPPKGTTALFKAGTLNVLCRVVWARDGQCGVRFDESIPDGLLKSIQLQGVIAVDMLTPDEQLVKDDWVEGNAG